LLPHDSVPYVLQVMVAGGPQTPSPEHLDQADHIPVMESHVRVCDPQLPQLWDEAPGHVWLLQELYWQLPPHDSVPLFPQVCVAPGEHAPSPLHADHADHVPVPLSHVRVCVPQSPQLWDAAPVHVWLVHAPHAQLPPHDCVPPLPQLWDEFGAHAPSPVHADQADHVPVLLSHVRVCVPQLPQACDAAPVHGRLPHAFHVQLLAHDCVPPLPQVCVELGAHTPSPVHADQADHVSVAVSHVRVCMPQLPQGCEAGPEQPLASASEPELPSRGERASPVEGASTPGPTSPFGGASSACPASVVGCASRPASCVASGASPPSVLASLALASGAGVMSTIPRTEEQAERRRTAAPTATPGHAPREAELTGSLRRQRAPRASLRRSGRPIRSRARDSRGRP
jgi:hypothetical protein